MTDLDRALQHARNEMIAERYGVTVEPFSDFTRNAVSWRRAARRRDENRDG